MDIYEFTALSIDQKADALWKDGHFIDNYFYPTQGVNLYHLSNFFVEVIISKPDEEIIEITPFKQGFRLDKYTEKINLYKLIG